MQNGNYDFRKDYDGSVFVNCRSFTEPMAVLQRLCSQQSVSLTGLSRVLEFIQTCALSQTFYYDASVPSDTLDAMGVVCERLKGIVTIEGSELDYNELFNSSVEAVANAQLQLEKVARNWSGYVRRPLPEDDAIALMKRIRERVAAGNQGDQEALSYDVLESGIRGRKMLAGLVHPSNSELFGKVFERIDPLSLGDQAALLSGVINVFRGHLLSTWAAKQYSAYQLLELPQMPLVEYNRLAWEEVVRHISVETPVIEELQEKGIEDISSLAPVGLWALLKTDRSASPEEVIGEAVSLLKTQSGSSLRKVMWDAVFDPEKHNELEVLRDKAESQFAEGDILPRKLNIDLRTLLTTAMSAFTLFGVELGVILTNYPNLQPPSGITTGLGIASTCFGIWLGIRRVSGEHGYINFRVRMSGEIQNVNLSKLGSRVNLDF